MLVIIVIGSAFVLGMGYLCSASVRLAGSGNFLASAKARSAAEAAIEHAKSILYTAPQTAATITQNSPSGPYALEGNVFYRFYFAPGSGTDELYTPVGVGSCGLVTNSLTATIRAHNQYAETIMALSPEAFWRLGETFGTFAQDQTSRHSGWYMNGVSLGNAPALIGSGAASARFDGTNDYVDVGTFNLSASAMTLAVWIKADAGTLDNRFVLSKEADLWTLSMKNSSGRILASFRLKANSDTTVSGGTVTAGTWTHIVGVYDGTNMILYQDGAEVARGANSGPVKTSDKPVWVGGESNGGPGNLWLGYIEELALFQGALSPAQVRLLYGCRNPRLTVVNWNE